MAEERRPKGGATSKYKAVMAVAKKVKIAGIDLQLTISAAQVLLEEMATRTLLRDDIDEGVHSR